MNPITIVNNYDKQERVLYEIIDPDSSEGEAIFKLSGELVAYNNSALNLLNYPEDMHLKNLSIRELITEESAALLPSLITEEYLSPNEYRSHVIYDYYNKPIPVKASYKHVVIDGKTYFMIRFMLVDGHQVDLSQARMEQQVRIMEYKLKDRQKQLQKITKSNELRDDQIEAVLLQHYPSLSQNDIKLCSLIYKGIEPKSTAMEMGMKVSSIYIARKRLRKRLRIPSERNLDQEIIRIILESSQRLKA